MIQLSELKRLSEVSGIRDLPAASSVMYPGPHCPLFGAVLALEGITDAVTLVVGNEECTYYAKTFTLHRQGFGGLNGRCVSLVLGRQELTFGCGELLREALLHIVETRHPPDIFLITTCLIEIIGEDTESIARQAAADTGVPVLVIHTEHFSCYNHLPGMERTLTACIDIMEKPDRKPDGVNILGNRVGVLEDTELYHALRACGVDIRVCLPAKDCRVEGIRNAAQARLNIVVDPIVLPLANAMQDRFGIPFVMFYRDCDPDKIYAGYLRILECLDINIPAVLQSAYERCRLLVADARREFAGKSFIYGNSTSPTLAFTAFLVKLGMEPLLIQIHDITETDQSYIDEIIESGWNPRLTHSANLIPTRALYVQLKPDYFIGHESEDYLRERGITQITTDSCGELLGFAYTEALITLLRHPETATRSAAVLRRNSA
jgi:nitrogenase molybdenum-cofactor synthesis protein NifE